MENEVGQTIIILIIIIVCGIIGGVGKCYREKLVCGDTVVENIILGIIAALTIPLFLNVVASSLLDDLFTNNTGRMANYLIFSGFCILASFSSLNFLSSISGSVLRTIKEEIKELKEDNNSLKNENTRIDNNFKAIAPISEEKQESSANLPFDGVHKAEILEIMTSIQNNEKKFRPLENIKSEVNQDNRTIENTINDLKQNNLVKEILLRDGTIAVALSENAEKIVNECKI